MNIGIKSIHTYCPEYFLDNFEQSKKWGVEKDFINNKIGSIKLSRMKECEDTTDIAQYAVENLFQSNDSLRSKIQCLIVVTQNPDNGGLPHSSAILHKKLELEKNCAVFDLSLGCSGYVQGLSIAKAFMESQGFKNGILVTADPYSKIIDANDRDTALLFGDAATATWLGENPLWSIKNCDFGIVSDKYEALQVSNSKLVMKGREVFNFAAFYVPKSIQKVLNDSGLKIEDIDMVLLHQGSRFIVETLARRLGTEGRTPFSSKNYGNTISSSIPMMLAELNLHTSRRILLSGFGVGLSWATCILEKIEK